MRLTVAMVSTAVKAETEDKVDMMPLTSNAMRRDVTLVKIANLSGFKHCWKLLG